MPAKPKREIRKTYSMSMYPSVHRILERMAVQEGRSISNILERMIIEAEKKELDKIKGGL